MKKEEQDIDIKQVEKEEIDGGNAMLVVVEWFLFILIILGIIASVANTDSIKSYNNMIKHEEKEIPYNNNKNVINDKDTIINK